MKNSLTLKSIILLTLLNILSSYHHKYIQISHFPHPLQHFIIFLSFLINSLNCTLLKALLFLINSHLITCIILTISLNLLALEHKIPHLSTLNILLIFRILSTTSANHLISTINLYTLKKISLSGRLNSNFTINLVKISTASNTDSNTLPLTLKTHFQKTSQKNLLSLYTAFEIPGCYCLNLPQILLCFIFSFLKKRKNLAKKTFYQVFYNF